MCTSQLSDFRECFPREHRPQISELEMFWNNGVESLFRKFAEYIMENYDLRFAVPTWSEEKGWTYRIGKSGVYLIKGIIIESSGFVVEGIKVIDEISCDCALQYVGEIYEEQKDEFLRKISEINAKQAKRTKFRQKREQEELRAICDRIIPEKYNVFRWPEKLDIHKLKKLYLLDAQGIHDDILADEIGLCIYIRCKYGKEDMERMEKSVLRCHNCGNEIEGKEDLRQCICGYQYSFREYRRSFRRNNMPTGAAAKIFDEYIVKWNSSRDYKEKMILIDNIIHEFHLSLISGTIHRPVAMNFIDGTRKSVEKIIKELSGNV